MMDFITIPLVVGTITLGIYKLFELFVCKKERIAMIEKLADRVNTGEINSNLSLNLNYSRSRFTFGSLKSGLLMLGIGLGHWSPSLSASTHFRDTPLPETGTWNVRQVSCMAHAYFFSVVQGC